MTLFTFLWSQESFAGSTTALDQQILDQGLDASPPNTTNPKGSTDISSCTVSPSLVLYVIVYDKQCSSSVQTVHTLVDGLPRTRPYIIIVFIGH